MKWSRTLPHRRYLAGTLYPQNTSTDDVEANDEADGAGGSLVRIELADDPVKLANESAAAAVRSASRSTSPEPECCDAACGAWGTR